MTDNDEKFLQEVESCIQELATPLANLSARYSPLAAVIGIAMHANAILQAAVDCGQCDHQKAQDLLLQLATMDFDPVPMWHGHRFRQ